jgi:pimeloyl-ACP methyl ester carboxylesterase
MPTTRRSGVRIFYRTIGEGSPVVLVHGYTASGWSNWLASGWADQLGESHRLIIPDLRGHGRSQKPWRTEAYSVGSMAADVLAVMDKEGIERAPVFGYSMGGIVGLSLLLDHSERFSAGVIGGMGSYFPRSRGRFAFERQSTASQARRRSLAEQARFLAGYAAMADPIALDRVFRGVFRGQPPVDASRLGSIHVPVLVAAGTEDAFFEPAADLARRIPRAQFVPLPNEGHISAVRNPKFMAAVRAFLSAVGQPA